MDEIFNQATDQTAGQVPCPASQDPCVPTHGTLDFIEELERLLLLQQEPLATLKLAAYAADAMRVLATLGRQADISPKLADTLQDICPDWRNPGALDDPADLIAVALYGALEELQKTMTGLEHIVRAVPIHIPNTQPR